MFQLWHTQSDMLTAALAAFLLLAPQQKAGNAEITFTGSNGTLDSDQGFVRCLGGCVLVYQDMRFESDWIHYDKVTGDVAAGDHIHFTRGAEQIDGTHMNMNVETKAGKIWDATGKLDPGFHVKARIAEKFEDDSWEFRDTTITACESSKPCWTFTLARAWFRQGQWIRGTGGAFRFHGVPLFWVPFISAPSESKDRSTGFLIPSISNSSTKGFGVHDEFFYVISDNADASFTGEYFSKRGAAGDIGFRAKPTATGWISANTFFVKDKLAQGGYSLKVESFSNWGKYSRSLIDLETDSSVTFRQVWGQSFSAIVSPINRSTGFLSTNMPNSSINVLYSHDAYLHVAPSVVLRKFPSIEGSMNSRQIFQNFPAYFRFDSSFSGISRRDANISTPAFVERFDFHPSIQTPIWRGNAFELSQEFGFRETAYSHSLQPAVEQSALMRSTFDYTASFSGPELTKSYGTWRHTIQPTVEYRYVTGADRFRETIIVDDIDLVANTSEVEYGITNRIMGDRELLRWRIAQVAYFDPTFGGAFIDGQRNVFEPLLSVTGASFADSPRHHSPIVSTFRLTPNKANAVEVQVDYDTQLHAARSAVIGNTLARGKWSSSILYAFTKATLLQASNNQLHGMVSYGNLYGRGFAVTTNVGYDVQSRQFQGATTQLGYNSECWGVSVEFSEFNLGARQEHKLRFAFNLKNIGSLGTLQRPDRVF